MSEKDQARNCLYPQLGDNGFYRCEACQPCMAAELNTLHTENERLKAEMIQTIAEQHCDALDGQATMDECNNDIIRLRTQVSKLQADVEKLHEDLAAREDSIECLKWAASRSLGMVERLEREKAEAVGMLKELGVFCEDPIQDHPNFDGSEWVYRNCGECFGCKLQTYLSTLDAAPNKEKK